MSPSNQVNSAPGQPELLQAQDAFRAISAEFEILKARLVDAGLIADEKMSLDTSRAMLAPDERLWQTPSADIGPPSSVYASTTLPARLSSTASRRFLVTHYTSGNPLADVPRTSYAHLQTLQHPAVLHPYVSVSNAGRYGSRGDTSREAVVTAYERRSTGIRAQDQLSTPPLTPSLVSTREAVVDYSLLASENVNADFQSYCIQSTKNEGFVDHLALTPSTTSEKVKLAVHITPVHCDDESRTRLDLGAPKHCVEERRDVQGRLPLRKPGDDKPWKANETNLHAAHREGFVESISHSRIESSDTLDTCRTVSGEEEENIPQSSWKRRAMISALTKTRLKFLREHAERTAALNGEERGAQYQLSVDQQSAVDFFIHQSTSATGGRRVAVEYETTKTYTPGTAEAQAKMRDALAKLGHYQDHNGETENLDPSRNDFQKRFVETLEQRKEMKRLVELRDGYRELSSTLPQRVRPTPMLVKDRNTRRDIDDVPLERDTDDDKFNINRVIARGRRKRLEASWALQEEPGTDEEYDTLNFNTPDELEHYFDKLNVLIGLYDKDEMELWIRRQWKKKLSENSRKQGGQTENEALLQQLGLNEAQLDHSIEDLRQGLVKSGKLLPAKPTRSKIPSSQRSTVAPAPSSRKRKASTVDAQDIKAASVLEQLRLQDSGPNEGCDGYANGCSCTTCSSTGTSALLNEVNRRLIVNVTNYPNPSTTATVTSTTMTGEETIPQTSSSGRQIKKPKLFGG